MSGIRIDVYHHIDPTTPDPRLDRVIETLKTLTLKADRQMASLADIQTAVNAERTVEDGVVTLLNDLAAQLKTAIASNDPVAMQAIVDSLAANSAAMAAAVTANTPGGPVVVTPPDPIPDPVPDPVPTPTP